MVKNLTYSISPFLQKKKLQETVIYRSGNRQKERPLNDCKISILGTPEGKK